MKPENIVLLARLATQQSSGYSDEFKKTPIVDEFRQNPIVDLTTNELSGSRETMHQVWYSPTGFGSKDDVKQIGYICLPYIVRLNEHKCPNYKLAVLSTNMWENFKDDFKKVVPIQQVSVEHQKAFFPYLFIE